MTRHTQAICFVIVLFFAIKLGLKGIRQQVIIDLCMRITHSNERFYVPYFTGLIYSGTVLWGDGAESKYADNIYHDYQDAGEVCVELSFKAGDDEHVVTLGNMTGIKEIDLSGM